MSEPNYNGWTTDARQEFKERIENGDTEFEEYVKEESPYLYWGYDFTPDPPPEVVEELGLDE